MELNGFLSMLTCAIFSTWPLGAALTSDCTYVIHIFVVANHRGRKKHWVFRGWYTRHSTFCTLSVSVPGQWLHLPTFQNLNKLASDSKYNKLRLFQLSNKRYQQINSNDIFKYINMIHVKCSINFRNEIANENSNVFRKYSDLLTIFLKIIIHSFIYVYIS